MIIIVMIFGQGPWESVEQAREMEDLIQGIKLNNQEDQVLWGSNKVEYSSKRGIEILQRSTISKLDIYVKIQSTSQGQSLPLKI